MISEQSTALIRASLRNIARLKPVFMVVGRHDKKWVTLLSKTDDIRQARRILYSAADDYRYKRIVLCKALERYGEIDLKWETFECALPISARILKPSEHLSDIIERIRASSANKNFAVDLNTVARENNPQRKKPKQYSHYLSKNKRRDFANASLSLCLMGAALNLNGPALLTVLGVIFIDWLYVSRLMDTFTKSKKVTSYFRDIRNGLYCAIGLLMIIIAMIPMLLDNTQF